MLRRISSWICLGFVLCLVACGTPENKDGELEKVMAEVAKNYAAMVYANYTDVETKTKALKEAIDAFVGNPTQDGLDKCKKAWLEARDPYGQTEVYRFYNGPIEQEEREGRINAWPLDESYIDYVEGNADSGIVNKKADYPEITKDLLRSLNEKDGETNIAVGYHAIEFLLWGQDLNTSGPGSRPHTDFVDGGTASNQDRRRKYLQVVAEMLIEDLSAVKEAWKPDTAGNYAATFIDAAKGKDAVQKMLLGMGSLSGGELSGERMNVAFESKDQEDEHSCFSDNTYADILNNATGIQNVFLGRYGSVQGKGIYDLLVAAGKQELADKLKKEMEDTMTAVKAMPGADNKSFDQLLVGADTEPGRVRIKAVIDALRLQTKSTAEAAAALGITINLDGN